MPGDAKVIAVEVDTQPLTPSELDEVFVPLAEVTDLPEYTGLDKTEVEAVHANSPADPPAHGEVVVWSAFHSEASAAGFANRLTRQLSHPFEVRKLGPANYVVFYTYADPAQQQAIEQRIAEVTGVSAS